jgi:hypothetical protein
MVGLGLFVPVISSIDLGLLGRSSAGSVKAPCAAAGATPGACHLHLGPVMRPKSAGPQPGGHRHSKQPRQLLDVLEAFQTAEQSFIASSR